MSTNHVKFVLVGVVFALVLLLCVTIKSGYVRKVVLSQVTIPSAEKLPSGRPEKGKSSTTACSTEATRLHIQNTCQTGGWVDGKYSPPHNQQRIFIDDKHKVVYCFMSKVGSRTMREYLGHLNIGDRYNRHMGGDLKMFINMTNMRVLSELSVEEKNRVLLKGDYLKFAVLRHPFDRLLSAWNDKLASVGFGLLRNQKTTLINDYFHMKYPKRNFTFNHKEHTLGFKDFVALVSLKFDMGFTDQHWSRYTESCVPCDVDYDYFFRLETFQEDVQALYKHIRGILHTDDIPVMSHDNDERGSSYEAKLQEVSDVFRKIDPDVVEGLLEVYKDDFDMFGYHWDNKLGATCSFTDDKK